MVELDYFARFYKMSDEEVIEKLKAGVYGFVPRGGAEILLRESGERSARTRLTATAGLISGKVHAAGLKTNATMLYGHVERHQDRVDHRQTA
jgi:aminodeoxyfutalosine synthase